jgi:predicted phage terminase large subunit-like protein
MVSVGLGGAITGKGGHLVVIDDPIKGFKESRSATIRNNQINSFNNDLYTRLEPGASIVVLMTRWHQEDLSGYLLEEHEDDWIHINLAALAEDDDALGRELNEALCVERYDQKALFKIKKAVGSVAWNNLYQQKPSADEGTILKRDWWRFYDETEIQCDELIQSWDMRFKDSKTSGDYVVGQVWGRKGNNKYLLDQVRGRWSFVETQNMFLSLSSKWPKAYVKLVENKANGPAIENVLKSKVSGIKLVEPMGGKEARAFAAQPSLEGGTVYLPNPENEPWVYDFMEECANFPSGKHDDMVDTATQAIIHFERKLNTSLYKLAKF